MAGRLRYIDWLRVLAVLLLFPFHLARVFNVGEPFYVKAAPMSLWASLFVGTVGVWHMPLLFLLAGASSYLALRKRTPGAFTGERLLRLGVPFLFGILAITPLQGWFGARFNSGYTGSFVDYVKSGMVVDMSKLLTQGDYFGGFVVGHLWFIVALLIFSLAALPLLAWGRGEKGGAALARWSRRLAKPAWWILPAVILWITEGLPKAGDKPLIYFFTWFVLGAVALRDEAFQDSAERFRWVALPSGLAISLTYALIGNWRESLPDPSLMLSIVNITGMLGAWMTVVGLIGMAKRHLNAPSGALSYLAEASYPIYLLHQTVIVVAAFYLVDLAGGNLVRYPLLVVGTAAITFGIYEIVRRVGPLRFAFGMRPVPAQAAVSEEKVA